MSEDKIGGEKAILEERRKKLENLRDKGVAYANSFRPKNSANEIHNLYDDTSKDDLAEKNIKNISIAGRIVLKRVMGNASFATLRDASGDIQIYVTKTILMKVYTMILKHGIWGILLEFLDRYSGQKQMNSRLRFGT